MRPFLRCLILVFLLSGNAAAQWVKTDGPPGGAIHALAADPSTIYAGVDGVYRSTSGGEVWTRALQTEYFISALFASETLALAGSFGGELFLSTDRGVNWAEIPGVLPPVEVSFIGMSPQGTLFVAAFDAARTERTGLYRSTDNGATWTEIDLGEFATPLSFTVSDNYLLIGGTGVLRSTDDGLTWQSSTAGVRAMTLAAAGPIVMAGDVNSVHRSTDNGATWTLSTEGMDETPDVHALTVSGGTFYAGTQTGIYSWSATGNTWSRVNTGLTNTQVLSLTASAGTLYAGTMYGGVNRSTNGGVTWEIATEGIRKATIQALQWDGGRQGIVRAGTNAGLFSTRSNGQNWRYDGLRNAVNAIVEKDLYVFAGTGGDGVFRSSDAGDSWVPMNEGLDGINRQIHSLLETDGNILAGTGTTVFRSTDDGFSWMQTSGIGGLFIPISAMTTWDGDIYAGSSGYMLNGDMGSVYRSTDNGITWSLLPTAAEFQNRRTDALAAHGGYLWAGSNGLMDRGIYRYSKIDKEWVRMKFTDDPEEWIGVLALLPVDDRLYVGTTRGIFYTTDNGASWLTLNDGLPTMTGVSALLMRGRDLYAGTVENSVWAYANASGIDEKREVTTAARLGQSTPNPSSGVTTIDYRLTRPGNVTIRVYDLLGRTVATPVARTHEAGEHSVSFDVSGLHDGVYYYSLSIDGSLGDVRTMIVQ